MTVQADARLLAIAARMATALGMRAGISVFPNAESLENFYVIVIDLEKVGQVIFHIDRHDLPHFAFLAPYEDTLNWHGEKERNRRLEIFSKTFQKK